MEEGNARSLGASEGPEGDRANETAEAEGTIRRDHAGLYPLGSRSSVPRKYRSPVRHGMMPYSRPALLPHFGKPYYFRKQLDWSTAFPTISLDRIHDSYG
jgi:hypothetical protein